MEIGDIWNGWVIKEKIGEGSYGKVYRIVREEYGHVFESALKVIRIPQNQSELKSAMSEGMTKQDTAAYYEGMVRDLVNEIVLMDDLDGNNNIVRYQDHLVTPLENEFGWDIFIRMELLLPLVDYMNAEQLDTEKVISLGMDICNALEECHSYHIIHRDIKPENIFYSKKQNCFKLGDFGIARRFEKTSGMSKKGTYSYMAPEVYKGLPYNETVDEYSLGILLYQLLNNNRLPFMPDYPERIHFEDKENANYKRLSGEAMKPPCNADDQLSQIILKACSYDPKNRYGSIAEMENDLSAMLQAMDNEDEVSETEQELSNVSVPENDAISEENQNDVIPKDASFDNNHEETVVMFESDLKRTEPVDQKEKINAEPEEDSENDNVELTESPEENNGTIIEETKSDDEMQEEEESEKDDTGSEPDDITENPVNEKDSNEIQVTVKSAVSDDIGAKASEEVKKNKEIILSEERSNSLKYIAVTSIILLLLLLSIVWIDDLKTDSIYSNYSTLEEVWESDDREVLAYDMDTPYYYDGLHKRASVKENTVKIDFYREDWHQYEHEELSQVRIDSDMQCLADNLSDWTGYNGIEIKVTFYNKANEVDLVRSYYSKS